MNKRDIIFLGAVIFICGVLFGQWSTKSLDEQKIQQEAIKRIKPILEDINMCLIEKQSFKQINVSEIQEIQYYGDK